MLSPGCSASGQRAVDQAGCTTVGSAQSGVLGEKSADTVAAVDPKDMVRRGYDAVSWRYRDDDAGEGEYAPWIAGVRERVDLGGAVLDLGCGCGVPVARALVEAGFAVTGVDFSKVQIRRCRELVPGGEFVRADLAGVEFLAGSFDAVVSFYALIHVPVAEQPGLLRRIGTWLRPGGWFAATVGHAAWTGTEENWLGGGATMFWSHADAAAYRLWIQDAGLTVEIEEFVPEGDGGHTFFGARSEL